MILIYYKYTVSIYFVAVILSSTFLTIQTLQITGKPLDSVVWEIKCKFSCFWPEIEPGFSFCSRVIFSQYALISLGKDSNFR